MLVPSVLLFDEPPSNLDARLRRSMREEIRTLQQRLGLTVACVTHDQAEALVVSEQIIVMDLGVIAARLGKTLSPCATKYRGLRPKYQSANQMPLNSVCRRGLCHE